MPFLRLPNLRRRERATLSYCCAGELGRGAYSALCREFVLVVAVSHFAVADRSLLWFLSSASFFGLTLAAFSAALASKWRKKTLIRALEVFSRALAVAAAFSAGGAWFVVLMTVGIATNATATPLISGIYGANFNSDVRGRVVGRLQAVTMGTAAVVAFAMGAALEQDTALFRPLLVAAAAVSLACSLYAWRLPEPRPAANAPPTCSPRDFVSIILTDRTFLCLEAVWFLIGICNLWLIPVRVLHLNDIGFTERQILLATTTTMSATTVLSMAFWGRLLYRMNLAFYRMLTVAFFIAGIAVFFSSQAVPMVCLGAALWSTGMAGGTLSWRLVATFFTTPDRGPAYMSVHTFFCGVRGILGPLISLRMLGFCTTQTIAWISIGGLAASVLMLLPLAPIMARRQRMVEDATPGAGENRS